MPMFRRKPLIVEAVQLTWANWSEMCDFAGVGPGENQPHGLYAKEGIDKITMTMLTPNGMVMAQEGDWVLKDAEGNVYPCKASVFEKSYEPVGEFEGSRSER